MAHTILRRRRDGVIAIGRRSRWPLVCVAMAAGLLVVLPLALSLVIALPPLALAMPPLTLGLGTWILLRRLDAGEPRWAQRVERSSNVIPLSSSPRRRGPRSSTRPHR